MPRRVPLSLIPVLMLLITAARVAAADSIDIATLTPAAGAVPAYPGAIEATVQYTLESSLFGQLAVFVSQVAPAPGPGQTSPGGGFQPVWVQKGKGSATVKFFLNCTTTSVSAGEVVQVLGQLSQSQQGSGPLGPVLASTTRQVRYTFACPTVPSPHGKPDITADPKGIVIAGHLVPWGGFVELKENEAKERRDGVCLFKIRYEMENLGPAATAASFVNRLRIPTAAGAIAAQASFLPGALGPAGSPTAHEPVNDLAHLKPGLQTLQLYLDEGSTVAESNEGNNTFSIRYKLDGHCLSGPVP